MRTRDFLNDMMQPDGKTVKVVMTNEASTLLKTVSYLKVPRERVRDFDPDGNKYRITRTS